MANKDKTDKPPLGLCPKDIHWDKMKIARYHDIRRAIERYIGHNDKFMPIPLQWVVEYNELAEYFNQQHIIP